MTPLRNNSDDETKRTDATVIAVVRGIRLGVVVLGVVIMLAVFGGLDWLTSRGQAQSSAHTVSTASTHVALDIMPVKPGGPAANYAAFLPSTLLIVPANSTITMTIRNFDLDSASVPEDSANNQVQGTLGGVAYIDGTAFTVLPRNGIAHTFTVPDLHLNVPIPGKSASGQRFVTVSFSFHTGQAGTYSWRCFASCGDGPDEQAGPMAEVGYMRGTLLVAQ